GSWFWLGGEVRLRGDRDPHCRRRQPARSRGKGSAESSRWQRVALRFPGRGSGHRRRRRGGAGRQGAHGRRTGSFEGKQMSHNLFGTLQQFRSAAGTSGKFYSLPALAKTFPSVARLPVSIRIVLEAVLRNCDGKKISEEHVRQLANWKPNAARV